MNLSLIRRSFYNSCKKFALLRRVTRRHGASYDIPGRSRKERAWSSVERHVFVSDAEGVKALGLPGMKPLCQAELEEAGVLCADRENIYCASGGGQVIWRLHAGTLTPRALFAGGPEVCDMRLSMDGRRLYVLCGGADSVLLLDAMTGAPQILARAGVNPRRLALCESEGILAVAGGKSCSVLLLDMATLELLAEIPMPGIVCDAALAGAVFGLCQGEGRNALLAWRGPEGIRQSCPLPGLPGALAYCPRALYAATEGRISRFAVEGERVHGYAVKPTPGCASRLAVLGDTILYIDLYTQSLVMIDRRRQKCLCPAVRDMIVC